jgi:D5 N terminal like
MPVIIVKKAQVGAASPASAQSEATLPAMPSPATDSHDATDTAGNDNYQQPAVSEATGEQPINAPSELSPDDGLLDDETGEPLAANGYLEQVDESAWPGEVDHEPVDEAGCDEPELTEDYVAHAFIDRYGPVLRFDHDVGYWYGWNGTHWRKDETRATFDKVRSHCRALRGPERMMSSRRAIEGVEVMASRDRRVTMTTRDWNTDPWVLGSPGGYVNLKTGELFDADPTFNVSQLTSVAPAEIGAAMPHFAKFLDEVTQGASYSSTLGIVLPGSLANRCYFLSTAPGETSTPRGHSPDRRPSSPISRATPIASPSRIRV